MLTPNRRTASKAKQVAASPASQRARGRVPSERPPAERYHHGRLREALIEAALDMLHEDGQHDFSMRELAERVQVTRTAPAHHFKDKNGLLAAVVTEGYRMLVDRRLEALRGLRGDAREKLIASALAYVRFALDEPALFTLMFSRMVKNRDQYPDLVVAQRTAYYMLDDFTTELGPPFGDRDQEAMVPYGLWSLMHGIATLKINQPGAPSTVAMIDAERLTRELVSTFLDGVLHGQAAGLTPSGQPDSGPPKAQEPDPG